MWGLGKVHPEGTATHSETKPACHWRSRTLLRHFCMGIVEGQESPTAAISGGDAVVVPVVGSPKEGTTVLKVLLPS